MRTGSALVVLGVAFALAGCSTSPAIQRGAAQGAQMTVELRSDIDAVVRAQDQLYEERLESAVISINELYNEKQRLRVIEESRAFARSNAGKSTDKVAEAVPKFMTTSMRAWAKRHEDYEKVLTRARRTHEKNRRAVQADESKLDAMRTRFVALSDSKSRTESVKFLVGFAKEVRAEIEKQEKAAAKPATK
jgi:hypothetical protein